MTTQKDDHGRSNALAGYDNIRAMVAALECDYDRLEELREERGNENDMAGETIWAEGNPSGAEELAALEIAAGECSSRDDAEQRIHEEALEIQVRNDWHTPGESSAPSEFYILLTTGGPALRIHGELDEHGEPSRAWLEYQDWGTPWTQLINDKSGERVSQDVLLTYARCFYFGEG